MHLGCILYFVDKADSVNITTVKTQLVTNKTGAIHIRWEDPPNPNGLIVTYEIEYMKSSLPDVSVCSLLNICCCILL